MIAEIPCSLLKRDTLIKIMLTALTEGTGLGLAIIRQIVKFDGGSVRAASTLGKESTFTLPLAVRGAI